MRGLERGVLITGPLQLQHGERKAVDVQDDVETAVALAVDDGDLVEGAVDVRVRVVQVDEADGRFVLGAEGVGVGDGADAGRQVRVRGAVLLVRVLGARSRRDGDSVANGIRRQVGVKSLHRLLEVRVQDQIGPRLAVAGTGSELASGSRLPGEPTELAERE